MRDDEIRRLMAASSPWWAAAAAGTDPTAWTSGHRLLRERATYDLGYRATILDDVADSGPDGRLIVLTGPRRLGKSVVLIDTAARLFDQISAIQEWTSIVKAARDSTDFGDDTVVATGSRWVGSEDVQGNLLAGRAGNSTAHRIRLDAVRA